MNAANKMVQWTIYDHPKDYPDKFVVRQWIITPGKVTRGDVIMASPDLESIRKFLRSLGLQALERDLEDDPTIVETWL